ncbi:Uncharacterised protein [Vibrio cholerae]|uniref:hypothetical protein n=2 Tax=Vibrio cholerae TaxID=666 RepID=UPI00157A6D73|nr:hypothetical protein [Vibrio cholerae]CAB1259794.1 Uncharacterised protein [Vibrio cholerae]
MLTHQDADCSLVINDKKYPHHIGSIIRLLEFEKIKYNVVNAPDAQFYGNKHYYNASSYNSWFFFTRFVSKLLLFFGLSAFSDKVSSFYWMILLKKMKVKLVIGIQPHPGLCIAGRKLNIPVFDYQHGVIDRGHWWYDNKAKCQPINHLPTDFLCWDSVAQECLNTWTKNLGINTHVVGNLWIYRFLYPEHDDPIFLEFDKLHKTEGINILVTLQPNLHKVYYKESDYWVMPNSLMHIINESADCYNWFIRLHPIQLLDDNRDRVEYYLKENFGSNQNVDWEICTKIPLPQLLSIIDMHITDMSTVVLDAEYFGIPSALMSLSLNDGMSLEFLYKKQRDQGIATVVGHDEETIKNWISSKSFKKNIKMKKMEMNFNTILSRCNNGKENNDN